jgi:hypothetical protein
MRLAVRGSPARVTVPRPGPAPPDSVPMLAKTDTTSGRAFMMRVACCTTASVSATVAPGGSSMAMEARPRSAPGTKSCGM